ncbi:MAG: bifunctional folylpolyglutamate synthase/dihydrofolate synthase, partial [Methylococcus sp.]
EVERARSQNDSEISLTYFEFSTLAILHVMAHSALDVAILEVGLGGRLDAVNIIEPDCAVITSVDLDHMEYLGDTREAIGREKAGIFRPGRPAVLADPAAPASVLRVANDLGAPLHRLNNEFGCQPSSEGWNWRGTGWRFDDLPLPAIPGIHQLMNASAVLACLELAADHCPVSEDAIRRGLRNVVLPGRSQFFPGERPVLLDVAHNPQAARILADHLARHFPEKPVRAVFSVMRDKDIHGILEPLRNRIIKWYLAPLQMARAANPEALAEILHNAGIEAVDWGFATVNDACRAAMEQAEPDDLLLVFGSFFLVSEFLANRVDRGC